MLQTHAPGVATYMQYRWHNLHLSREDMWIIVTCFAFEAEVVEVGFTKVEGYYLRRCEVVHVIPDFES